MQLRKNSGDIQRASQCMDLEILSPQLRKANVKYRYLIDMPVRMAYKYL